MAITEITPLSVARCSQRLRYPVLALIRLATTHPIKQRTTTPGSNASIDSQMPAKEAQGARRRWPRAHTNAARKNTHRTAPHPYTARLPAPSLTMAWGVI